MEKRRIKVNENNKRNTFVLTPIFHKLNRTIWDFFYAHKRFDFFPILSTSLLKIHIELLIAARELNVHCATISRLLCCFREVGRTSDRPPDRRPGAFSGKLTRTLVVLTAPCCNDLNGDIPGSCTACTRHVTRGFGRSGSTCTAAQYYTGDRSTSGSSL